MGILPDSMIGGGMDIDDDDDDDLEAELLALQGGTQLASTNKNPSKIGKTKLLSIE